MYGHDSSDVIKRIARQHATRCTLPLGLVLAIIDVESAGLAGALRAEPHYRYLWNCQTRQPFRISAAEAKASKPPRNFPSINPSMVSPATEYTSQKMSWGPMQVMGAVARELGFDGLFLSELCSLNTGIAYGCNYLATLRDRHGPRHGWAGAIRAYNTGRPQASRAGDAYTAKIGRAGYNPHQAVAKA